jgi:hypothetical protein
MKWFRWHHGTVTDAKWRVISRRSAQPIHAVIAVFAAMLERASEADDRGSIEGWSDEDIGAALDLSREDVAAIRNAMQGKVLDGDHLTGWSKRQPLRERPTDDSAERVRAFRERKRAEMGDSGEAAAETPEDARSDHETPRNSALGDVTPRNAAKRLEQIRRHRSPEEYTEEPNGSSAALASAKAADRAEEMDSDRRTRAPPPPPIDANAVPMDLDKFLWGEARVFLAHRMGRDPDSKAVRSLLGKWAKLYGNDVTLQAIRALQRQYTVHGEVHDAVAWAEKWFATNVRRTHGTPSSPHQNFIAGVGRHVVGLRDAGDDRRERRREVDAKVRTILGPAEPEGSRLGLPSPQ